MLRASILPSLAVVAIIGEAAFFGHVSLERPVKAVKAVRAIPSRALELQEQVLSALGPAQVGQTVGAAACAFPRRSADTGDAFTPVFDIVRVKPTGEAVIAGRAASAASQIGGMHTFTYCSGVVKECPIDTRAVLIRDQTRRASMAAVESRVPAIGPTA
jgi:hypothetical protein